jgi:hypothetical protein
MTVPIATRTSWGARYADGDLTLAGLAAEVFAHHTVTTQLPASATVEQERAQMRAIEQIGQSRFGTGISYNVVIFPSGRAYQGVSFNRRGTHTDRRNSTVRSICFAGNYETNQPTTAQIATAAAIYAEGRGKWWTAGAPLRGHRDIKATDCPGRHVYSRLGEIRSGATPVTNPVKPLPPVTPARKEYQLMRRLDLSNAHRVPVTGKNVKTLQALLLAWGHGPEGLVDRAGHPDGVAGAATRRELGTFQRGTKTGSADGSADFLVYDRTWAALLGID